MNRIEVGCTHPSRGHFCTRTMCLLLFCLALGCNSDSPPSDPVPSGPVPSDPVPMDSEPLASQSQESDPPTPPVTATDPPPFDRDAEIAKSQQLISQGNLADAAEALRGVLLVNPKDVEVIFRLAQLSAAMDDLPAAVAMLGSIPEDHPEAGLPALGQSADWCLQLQRYDDAETRYLKVLERYPDAAAARRQLAYLYNRQGRRHEAATHIRHLCKLGDVRQDELHALMVLSNAIYQDPDTQPPAGERPYWPIGPLAEARKLFTDFKYREAVELLHETVAAGNVRPSLMAFYGRVVAESQDDQRFLWWLARTDEQTKEFSEYWAALGTYLHNHRRFAEAVRALSESLVRDPSDAASMQRMHESLLALGRTQEAQKWQERYDTIRSASLASNRIGSAYLTPKTFSTVVDALVDLHRPLEAVMWEFAAAFHQKQSPEVLQELNRKRMAVLASDESFPDEEERLCGLQKDQFPLPELDVPSVEAIAFSPPAETQPIDPPRFENVASKIGLNHSYKIASEPQEFRFALYQVFGGGVAVLDYDLDGHSDLYFAQGASDPPHFVSDQSDVLYRNLAGVLADVTVSSAISQNRYSTGTTAGDWNQDGFADLVVTGIGFGMLMINNGDGTFTGRSLDRSDDLATLPSSLAMADVSGDSLPDLVEVLYAADSKMIERPELDSRGDVLAVAIASYDYGNDRIYVNDAQGGFTMQEIGESSETAAAGLGLVVTDFDGKPGNEIFIGNDTQANQYWMRSESGDWSDLAPLLGSAFGSGGITTASMGIATADFDGNETPDIHITNFYFEPASFFLNRGDSFEDRAIQFGLFRDSRTVLGFGTQAIDYNNDGYPDLVVTNGHIEKPANKKEPFHQPPQLFVNRGGKFQLTEVGDPSGYWDSLHLGRGLARLDFNNDGKSDFVVTHIGQTSALLINQTETKNHWLGIQLVGTESERDAIGAKVQVRAGEKSWSNWSIAGDGFLARNESLIPFGLGDAATVDEVTVTWPSGKQQVYRDIAVDRRLLLVENQAASFEL